MSCRQIVRFVAKREEAEPEGNESKLERKAVAHLKGFAEGIDPTGIKLSFDEGGFLDRVSNFENFVFDGDVLEDQSFTFVLPLIAARRACKDRAIRAHANLFDHHERTFLQYWTECHVDVTISEDQARFSIVRDKDLPKEDATTEVKEVEISYSIIEEKKMEPSTGCAYSDLGMLGLRKSEGTHVFCVGGGRTTHKEFTRSKTEITHSHEWVVWDVEANKLHQPGKRTSPLVGEAGVLVL